MTLSFHLKTESEARFAPVLNGETEARSRRRSGGGLTAILGAVLMQQLVFLSSFAPSSLSFLQRIFIGHRAGHQSPGNRPPQTSVAASAVLWCVVLQAGGTRCSPVGWARSWGWAQLEAWPRSYAGQLVPVAGASRSPSTWPPQQSPLDWVTWPLSSKRASRVLQTLFWPRPRSHTALLLPYSADQRKSRPGQTQGWEEWVSLLCGQKCQRHQHEGLQDRSELETQAPTMCRALS